MVANPLHYIIGGFYFGTLGNATAYSILPISDGGLKYFFIYAGLIQAHIEGEPAAALLYQGSDRKNLRTVQAGWQDSSPECGDRSNLPRTSDDDVYECSHTETDVRQIEKDIADNSVHVYESP